MQLKLVARFVCAGVLLAGAWAIADTSNTASTVTGVVIVGDGYSTNYPDTNGSQYRGTDTGEFSMLSINNLSTHLDLSGYIGTQARDTWVDAAGNIYISGVTSNRSMPSTAGTFQPHYGGGPDDAFICKYSSSFVRLWCSYLGTPGPLLEEKIYGIGGYDPSGNLVICGKMNGPYATMDGVRVTNIGPLSTFDHAYVAKIRPDGTRLVWFTMLGGSGAQGESDRGRCTVDGAGNVYAQGETSSRNFPVTAGAYQTSTKLGLSGWIAKLNANGSLAWSTYVAGDDGAGDAADSGILLAPDGTIYFSGYAKSTIGITTPGAFQRFNNTGQTVCYIGHLSNDGRTMLALTYLGPTAASTNLTECENITRDSAGDIYTYGITPSASFPVTRGAYQTVFGGGHYDMFVSKLNGSLSTLLASTFLGGSGPELADTAGRIHQDSQGNVWAAGSSGSANFPVTPNAFRRSLGGPRNMVVFELNSSLTALLYGTYMGGNGTDTNRSMWIF